jgi:nicotinamidase-related amidase
MGAAQQQGRGRTRKVAEAQRQGGKPMHKIELPKWADARGRALNYFPALEAGRTALVNIDMQNAFVAEDQIYGNAHAREIVEVVNALSAAMRAAGAPVIWTRQTYTGDPPFAPPAWHYDLSDANVAAGVAALAADAPGHELYPAMQVAPDDIVIDKYRYGAFSCPAGRLDAVLRARGIAMLVIAGTLTNVCCESTAREAYMRGYKAIAVADAMAAITDEEHNAALLNLRLNFADVRRTADVLRMIRGLAQT